MKLWSGLRKRIRLPKIPVRAWVRDHRQGLLRAGRIALVCGGLTFVVLLVHREVYSLVIGRKEYTVRAESFRISLAPSWAQGRNPVAVDLGADSWSIFDEEAVGRVGQAFARNPWIRRVTLVERVFPDRLRIKFDYRSPYATVRTAEGWIVVDRDRVRIPGLWAERPPSELATDVTGAGELPAVGAKWGSESLEAGFEVAELVESEPILAKAGVRAVDVSNVGGKVNPRSSEVALMTESGCVVYWGRPSSTKKFGELTTAQKIANLQRVLKEYPGLGDLEYARVCFKDPTVMPKGERIAVRRR